ncbi:MAG: hypothetical protein WBF73_04235 [Bradyrhizobium sp.]
MHRQDRGPRFVGGWHFGPLNLGGAVESRTLFFLGPLNLGLALGLRECSETLPAR